MTEAPTQSFPLEPAAIRQIILGVMLAMLLGAMDQTIVAPALPTKEVQLLLDNTIPQMLERVA